jgi:hypothetical protein
MIADGSVDQFYVEPVLHFTYPLFGWVAPFPGHWMHWEFYAIAAAAVGMIVGFAYRASALVVAVGFTHVFLIDKALYQNHYYLMCLMAWIAAILPAHRALSVDSLLRPSTKGTTAGSWTLWLLRFQIAVPYFYGGVAKLEADWLRGQPLRAALAAKTDTPLIGQFLAEEWTLWLMVYGGLLFDLLIVPALLWRRTRPAAFLLALCFHLTNATVFTIGVFPWLMGLATVLYFPADLLQRLLRLDGEGSLGNQVSGVGYKDSGFMGREGTRSSEWRFGRTRLALLATYVILQLIVPLRHFVYPGRANWTEQGHYFAWHMMLRGKISALRLYATDPKSGRTGTVNLRDYLCEHQAGRCARDPAMIHQLCQFVAQDLSLRGYPGVEIRALSLVGLNGRKPQLLIDPAVNLAHEAAPRLGCDWILPLTEPLRHKAWDVPLDQWEQHFELPQPLARRMALSRTAHRTVVKFEKEPQEPEM